MHPFPRDVPTPERADLDRPFSGWMAEAEGKIRKVPVAERKEMRDELYGFAIDIASRIVVMPAWQSDSRSGMTTTVESA